MKLDTPLRLGLLGLAAQAVADPTWPSDIDELEEIMYQTSMARSRKFADTVSSCAKEVSGPGRKNAAEWLRTAFHDMSTGNVVSGAGGLDASLQYELGPSTENTGPGFATTMTFMAPYLTRKSSMSDLIALGVYTSVISCGGPSINFQAGRIDASVKNNPGVPQPGEVIQVFRNKFARVGFSPQEMIQATACGHTIGGVHSSENSDIVPAGQFTNDVATFDSTDAVFDPKVITEYLGGSTRNPLVVVPGTARAKNSDFRVFNSDGNATVSAMTDPSIFNSTCKTVFEKMINVVPSGVTLGNVIKPYQVKPVQMQLSLQTVSTMLMTGSIRVRTTNLPLGNIAGLTINYKTRNGGTTCGSSACAFDIPLSGVSKGFEDSFAWFLIGQPDPVTIPVSSGISSFTVTIKMKDGSSTVYDNNGNGYPMQDSIFLQTDQSCLNQNNGTATFIAAVRNDRTSLPVNVNIWYKTKQTTSVVPLLSNKTLAMTKRDCKGGYTFYSVTTDITGGLSVESTLDFASGDMVDSFKKANIVGGNCQGWFGGSTCSSITVSPSSTSTSAAPTATLRHRDTVGGYRLVSCWTEASNGRALKGAAFAYDGMTLESCMGNCTGFNYWGTEYGRECYCGNSLDPSSTSAPLSDCSFACSGDSTEYCGAGSRIELYSTTATRSSTSTTPAPTATLAHTSSIGPYSLVGCQTEATNNGRALQAAQSAADDMTLDKCATFCSGYTYFGTEYGRECYCGNTIQDTSKPAPITECNMKCAGNPYQYCGDGNRLELYKLGSASTTSLPSTASATTTSSGGGSSVSTGSSTSPSSSMSPLTTSTLSTSSSSVFSAGSLTASVTITSSGSGSSVSTGSSTSPSSSVSPLTTSTLSTSSSSVSSAGSSTVPSSTFSTVISSVSSDGSSTVLSSTFSTVISSSSASPSSIMAQAASSSSSSASSVSSSSISTSTSNPSSSSSTASTSSSSSTSSGISTVSSSTTEVASSQNSITSVSSSSSVIPSTTTSSATSTTPILANKPTVAAYNLTGCWTEGNGVRALSQKSYSSNDNMTLEYCAAFCSDYKYFGTEYSGECYCGNFLAASSAAAPLSDCNMACSGNQFEYCGGGSRLTLYSNSVKGVDPTQPPTAGAYTFLGCRTEPAQGGRALGLKSTASDRMSNEVCADFCSAYTYFGTEYSGECYCGNTLPDTSLAAPNSDCNMVCSGSNTQFCGSGNRLSVYKK